MTPRHPITKVVPELCYIVPSQINTWRGSWSADGRFTGAQLNEMPRRGLDPATVETVLVKSKATNREMWWPLGTPAPVFQFECPVINERRDGRLLILAPAGVAKLVRADGRERRGQPTVERIEPAEEVAS